MLVAYVVNMHVHIPHIRKICMYVCYCGNEKTEVDNLLA